MITQKAALTLFFITFFLLLSSSIYFLLETPKTDSFQTIPISVFTPAPSEISKHSSVSALPKEQQIGQVLMVSIQGLELSQSEKVALRQGILSNILLFSKNIKDESQLKNLTNAIYQEATYSGLKPLIAVDQEGGSVSRIPWIESTGQSEIHTEETAYSIALKRGQQLKHLGILMNMSPVVEPRINPNSFITRQKRAFSSQSAQLAMSMVLGYTQAGIMPVAKHYPTGLSRTEIDPHDKLPQLLVEQEDVIADVLPFNGLEAPAIMVGHLLYPSVDASPTSASKRFISGMLRDDLKFEGLIVSDDLSMASISSGYDIGMYAQACLEAGVDIIIVTKPTQATQVREYLYTHCGQGTCNERMSQASQHVIDAKRTLNTGN